MQLYKRSTQKLEQSDSVKRARRDIGRVSRNRVKAMKRQWKNVGKMSVFVVIFRQKDFHRRRKFDYSMFFKLWELQFLKTKPCKTCHFRKKIKWILWRFFDKKIFTGGEIYLAFVFVGWKDVWVLVRGKVFLRLFLLLVRCLLWCCCRAVEIAQLPMRLTYECFQINFHWKNLLKWL